MSSVVRTLDSWESYFAVLNQQVPIHFVMAASLQGSVDDQQWVEALRALQQRHILLRSAIRPDGRGRLAFVEETARPVPITFLPRVSDDDVGRCYAEQLHTPIEPEASPLLRLLVLSSASQTDLVIACHHSIADAMSIAFLVRDLVNEANGTHRLAGEDSVPPSADALWQERFPDLVPLTGEPPETGPARKYLSNITSFPFVDTAVLGESEIAELRKTARQWHVSLHAVLCAAFLLAGAELTSAWSDFPVRVVTPVDLRERFGLGDEVCLAITAFGLGYRHNHGQDIQSLAKAVQRDLAQATTDAALYTATRSLAGLMQGKLDELLPRLVAFSPGYELMVSNLRVLDLEVKAGRLALDGVWGPNTLSQFEGQHSVGVSTYAGRLRLTYASYSGIPDLLKGVLRILACDQPSSLMTS